MNNNIVKQKRSWRKSSFTTLNSVIIQKRSCPVSSRTKKGFLKYKLPSNDKFREVLLLINWIKGSNKHKCPELTNRRERRNSMDSRESNTLSFYQRRFHTSLIIQQSCWSSTLFTIPLALWIPSTSMRGFG